MLGDTECVGMLFRQNCLSASSNGFSGQSNVVSSKLVISLASASILSGPGLFSQALATKMASCTSEIYIIVLNK